MNLAVAAARPIWPRFWLRRINVDYVVVLDAQPASRCGVAPQAGRYRLRQAKTRRKEV